MSGAQNTHILLLLEPTQFKAPTYSELVQALTQLVFMARTYGNAEPLIVACQRAEALINTASKETA